MQNPALIERVREAQNRDRWTARARSVTLALARSKLAASVETVACVWALAWAACLALNGTLLADNPTLESMRSHFSQPAWAMFATLVATTETLGLIGRYWHADNNRRVRLWGTMLMAFFFGCLAGELAATDPGVPGVYGYAGLAIFCILAWARLDLLPPEAEVTAGTG